MEKWLAAYKLPPVFSRALWARELKNEENLAAFFEANIANTISPATFGKPMELAVARIRQAFEKKEHIVIFGDYDVDGTTGAALIQYVLSKLSSHYGFSSSVMLSDRFSEGYGLNYKNIERLKGMNPNLVITVDCGISSASEIEVLKQSGIDTIVTDHHGLKGTFPSAAVAVVHPEYAEHTVQGCSGCGVAWQLMRGIWEMNGKESPKWLIEECLDLVALGIVCDVMPLNIPANRFYVKQGIKLISEGKRLAFRVMAEMCRWRKVSAYTMGFIIGPRLNASGRMDRADRVVDLLISNDPERCRGIVSELENHNSDRRRKQEESVLLGLEQLKQNPYKFIALAKGPFHEGVIGIAASKLAETAFRPAFVFADDGGDELKGSARSISGVDLFQLIERHQDFLGPWGGHTMAAGLTLPRNRFDEFFSALESDLALLPSETWEKVRCFDGILEESDLTPEFFQGIELLEPHGEKFPSIVWQMSGTVTGTVLDREGRPKVGSIDVKGRKFPFVMWNGAEQFSFGARNTFFGRWEFYDNPRNGLGNMQFKALDVLGSPLTSE